jgi:hypothetical protein
VKLVDDARDWWKWHSTYFYAVIAILPEVWLSSPDFQALLPLKVVGYAAPVIGLLGFYLRVRKQAAKIPAPVPPSPELGRREPLEPPL